MLSHETDRLPHSHMKQTCSMFTLSPVSRKAKKRCLEAQYLFLINRVPHNSNSLIIVKRYCNKTSNFASTCLKFIHTEHLMHQNTNYVKIILVDLLQLFSSTMLLIKKKTFFLTFFATLHIHSAFIINYTHFPRLT